MKSVLQEIAALADGARVQPTETGIPGLVMIKGDVPAQQLAALYKPMIGFVVRGSKTMSIGGREIPLRAPCYFVLPTHVPATARVRAGRDGEYLSLGLSLERESIQRLLKDVPSGPAPKPIREFSGCEAGPEFSESWLRLLRLRKTPRAIAALAPVYEREILFRVLDGPHGGRLRDFGLRTGPASGMTEVVHWIRKNYDRSLEIDELAGRACMAVTTFHRQFKRATGLSPIQFQKRLRLLEARNLLAFKDHTSSSAAYEVGYQSPTQFNREYARFFGAPPARDAAAFRRLGGSRSLQTTFAPGKEG